MKRISVLVIVLVAGLIVTAGIAEAKPCKKNRCTPSNPNNSTRTSADFDPARIQPLVSFASLR